MRKILTTAALMLALSCPAWAGIIHTPGSPEPLPQQTPTPATATQEPTALNGVMHIPPGAPDSLTQTVLGLLAVLPSLL